MSSYIYIYMYIVKGRSLIKEPARIMLGVGRGGRGERGKKLRVYSLNWRKGGGCWN